MKSALSFTAALVIAVFFCFNFASGNSGSSAQSGEPSNFCYISGYAVGYTTGYLYQNGQFIMTAKIDPQTGCFTFQIDVGCYTPYTVVVSNANCSATRNNVLGANCPVNMIGIRQFAFNSS